MTAAKPRTEVVSLNASTIEVRIFDSEEATRCRVWRMPMDEAVDLAEWFAAFAGGGQEKPLPGQHLRHGRIRVGISATGTVVEVHGLDVAGRARLVGCCMPIEVLRVLCGAVHTRTSLEH